MIKWCINIVFLGVIFTSFSQTTDQKLAIYYYEHGQCEKAIPYFEKVYKSVPTDYIYQRYLSCLQHEEKNKEVIQLMEQQIANYPYDVNYKVALGKEYEKQNNQKKAEKLYASLVENLTANPTRIIKLQRAFSAIGKNQLALSVLKKGDQLMNGRYPFNIQYAEVYSALNQPGKMIEKYIDLLDYNPQMLSSLKRALPRVIDFSKKENNERFDLFRKALIQRIQKKPGNTAYSRLLIWSFVQRKNFTAALIQGEALSRRLGDDGQTVFVIGNQAASNADYTAARKAFQYIVNLGSGKSYYTVAQQRLLNVRYLEITKSRNYSAAEIQTALQAYKTTLNSLPKNGKALPIIREMAEIQAYYGNDAEKAEEELNAALNYPNSDPLEIAKVKLLLADIKVLKNDVWNASLLYMQVEEKFKYEPIGEKAKFKNAQVFYYTGDFKYAQAQLDILKEATSKLIANNALNLSTFITENLGLDSNYTAMKTFAKADLLIKQHQYTRAFSLYDSITKAFPSHGLQDDILMRKASAYLAQKKWENAAALFQKITEKYRNDILADDALYQLANLYNQQLNQPQKAKDCYFKLMRDYPGSIFVTEARKSYRAIQ